MRQLPMIHLGQLIKACIGVSQRLILRLADKWHPLSGARQEHAQDVSPGFGALRSEHESARSIDFVNCRNHFALHPIFIILLSVAVASSLIHNVGNSQNAAYFFCCTAHNPLCKPFCDIRNNKLLHLHNLLMMPNIHAPALLRHF